MEKKIDITQKAPEQKEKNFKNDFKKFLFYLVQWTWGLPVNLVGGNSFLRFSSLARNNSSAIA